MAKKRGGAKAKNNRNAAKNSKPGPAKESTSCNADESEKGTTEGIKRGPVKESKQGSTEGTKRSRVRESKQGNAEGVQQDSKEGIKHGPVQESKQTSTEGIKRGPAEESKQINAEGIQQDSKEGIKHGPVKDNRKSAKGNKRKPAKSIKRELAEESKQDTAKANSDSSDESDDLSGEKGRPDFEKKIVRFGEKALEILADGIVEVLIFLEKLHETFRKCIQKINFITFFVFKFVMQTYLAVHFTQGLVYLLTSTGIHFEFPLEDANDLITMFRDYVAWDFKLFTLVITIIYFINDLVNTGHHEKNHVDGIWMLMLAEVEIFFAASPSDQFDYYLLMTLATITVVRLLFEVCYNDLDSKDLDTSLDFLPLLLFYQLVIYMFCSVLIFLYESSKFLEKYVPDISSTYVTI